MASTIIAQIFYYYSEYSLLICKPCKKAIAPRDAIGHFKTHLSRNQPELPHWLEIISALDIQPIGKSHEKIKENEPIPSLSSLSITDGRLCTWENCQAISKSHEQIIQHLITQHALLRQQTSPWFEPCKLQSLTAGRFLFRVELPPAITLPARPSAPPRPQPTIGTTPSTRQSPPAPPAPQQWAQNILHTFKARVQALEENSGPINIYHSKAEWSAFHSTIGTANFWNSRDLGMVSPLLGDELPKQRAILQLALFLLFRKAEIRVPFLPRQSRADLRSFDHRNPTFKEFRLLQKQKSREVYIMVMVKFIQFLLASYQHEVCDFIILYSFYAHFMPTLCSLYAYILTLCLLFTFNLLSAYFCLLLLTFHF
jgi:hypothetical protein